MRQIKLKSNIEELVSRYLKSDRNIEDFLEGIESTNIGVTPESSPLPSKKEKGDEDEEKKVDD
jgi:hypothetical protein